MMSSFEFRRQAVSYLCCGLSGKLGRQPYSNRAVH